MTVSNSVYGLYDTMYQSSGGQPIFYILTLIFIIVFIAAMFGQSKF